MVTVRGRVTRLARYRPGIPARSHEASVSAHSKTMIEQSAMISKLRVWTAGFVGLLLQAASADSILIHPEKTLEYMQTLNGEWSFKYIPALDAGKDEGFHGIGVEGDLSDSIRVPGNWELQGFGEPRYALELKDGLGLYRKSFRVPSRWTGGRRVCLRFDGVAYGFDAWVNGNKVGSTSASAYNPHTFDITDALKPDAANTLAVRVTSKPLGWEFDVNDDWALSGIFRDVTLFSVPAVHVRDITTRTKLKDDGDAELSVSVSVSQSEGEVLGKLIGPDGGTVSEFELKGSADGRHEGVVNVVAPRLWSAETPALYQLQLVLSDKGKPLQTIEERIGLREVSIAEGILKLNGRPIKLRGVNHHDLSPENGRAVTEEEMRRDLMLMKRGNINFIRTSHYPPHPRFIELCDEMGFYVMDEVSIGKGEEHLDDPKYRGNILARVEPTITRDKNRPSVIIWSIGNENPINDAELEACLLAKKLDPTRPVCLPKIGSYFAENHDRIPDYVDIFSPHYPGNTTLRRFARSLKRPVILTEYAHALGLATDRIQDQWEIIQKTPTFAGGAIWHFHDQGILRKSDKPVIRDEDTDGVWLDARSFYDTHGNDGCDGIVYSDRTPQTDFWQTRKVYAPVRIAETRAMVKPGSSEVRLTVENRHDFRPLTGMKLEWSLLRNGSSIQQGETPLAAASHEKETVRVSLDIPPDAGADVLSLDVRCVDENGLRITERAVRLEFPGARLDTWLAASPGTAAPKVIDSGGEIRIDHPRWILTVKKSDGALVIRDPAGHVLVEGIHPHPGRKLTMTEGRSAGKSDTWRVSLLKEINGSDITVTEQGNTVRLVVSGTYPRPQPKKEKQVKRSDEPLDQLDKPVEHRKVEGEGFVGGYQAEITPSGAISIRYDYVPTNAKGRFSEAGLSVVLPAGTSEFRWIGQGPYPGYPGKDQLNEFGVFHLNRADLNYQGNRRGVEVALATSPEGGGVAILTNTADVAVERDGDKTLLSHNAVISGLGNKGTTPETFVNVEKTPHVTGSFTLVPLEGECPAALTRWFGKAGAANDVFKPFYHSYDQ